MPDYIAGLSDDETDSGRKPAFVAGTPLRDHELRAAEWRHRNSSRPEFLGATEVIFCEEDDSLSADEATRWQRIMKWPRPPVTDEVCAFQAAKAAQLQAAFWSEMGEAVARDDAEQAAARAALAARRK
jgi:hypothetical protein